MSDDNRSRQWDQADQAELAAYLEQLRLGSTEDEIEPKAG